VRCSIHASTNLELIARLDDELFPGERVPDDILHGSLWWVAFGGVGAERKAVGYAGLQVFGAENKGFLSRAGVLPVARGHRLQQRLIRTRVAKARELGLARVYSYVWAMNIPSMRSLVRCGFHPYYADRAGATYIYLQKQLTQKIAA
jgi:GNAT superfamily N-acetyltransferase